MVQDTVSTDQLEKNRSRSRIVIMPTRSIFRCCRWLRPRCAARLDALARSWWRHNI